MECNHFLEKLDSLHSFLGVIHEKEIKDLQLFFDLLVKKSSNKFLTLVYKKSYISDIIHTEIHLNKEKENYFYWHFCSLTA